MGERKLHRYEGEAITVTFDLVRCIHSAECVKGLPEVFDPQRKPWVDPDRAPAERVAEVVRRCPTGALHYSGVDEQVEPVPGRNTARLVADGPLVLEGRLEIETVDGEVLRDTRIALCRCGASRHKPFCDGSHAEAGFEDPGELGAGRLPGDPGEGGGPVRIKVAADGPLLIDGPLVLLNAGAEERETGSRGALCRCGASAAKPYCDGSHGRTGFHD